MDRDKARMPKHVAMIMDGNGRWAKKRGMPRLMGHRAGVETLHRIVKATDGFGIPVLSVYAFSAENWKRPKEEVTGIMRLMIEYVGKEIDELNRNGVKITFMGEREGVPQEILAVLDEASSRTAENKGVVLNIAFNYGGRQAIAAAARELAKRAAKGEISPEDIDDRLLGQTLNVNGLPDPDLVIRTGGEYRLSNFLPYECTYSELVFTPVFWPDFDEKEYEKAIEEYQRRDRRFGAIH